MPDYYSDEEAAPAAPETEKEKPSETKTALIDSSICPDMKPGEEMVVKIEKVLDSEYLVSYAPEPGKEEEEGGAEEYSEGGEGEGEESPAGSMNSMMY